MLQIHFSATYKLHARFNVNNPTSSINPLTKEHEQLLKQDHTPMFKINMKTHIFIHLLIRA